VEVDHDQVKQRDCDHVIFFQRGFWNVPASTSGNSSVTRFYPSGDYGSTFLEKLGFSPSRNLSVRSA
jgi:hypothetical protein